MPYLRKCKFILSFPDILLYLGLLLVAVSIFGRYFTESPKELLQLTSNESAIRKSGLPLIVNQVFWFITVVMCVPLYIVITKNEKLGESFATITDVVRLRRNLLVQKVITLAVIILSTTRVGMASFALLRIDDIISADILHSHVINNLGFLLMFLYLHFVWREYISYARSHSPDAFRATARASKFENN